MSSPQSISSDASSFDLRQSTSGALIETFETMLNFTAEPSTGTASLPAESISNSIAFAGDLHGERVSTAVALVGEKVVGGIYIHMLEPFARQATAAMLGLTSEIFCQESDVNDAVSELTNMVGGKVKSLLCDTGFPCGLSIPSIVRGAAFEIEVPPDARHERFAFNCRSHRLVVEAHLKFN